MEKKVTFLGVLLATAIVVAVVHTVVHVSVYGAAISGFSIGPVNADGTEQNSSVPPVSQFVLVAEWMLVAGTSTVVAVRRKLETRKEIEGINLASYYGGSRTRTDLDVLHALLSEKKHLKVSTIAQLFQVSKPTVLEWSKILEMGNLATLYYPRLGEPSLVINTKS